MNIPTQHVYFTNNKLSSVQVNYLSRDFQTIRQDLLNYLKLYFPDQWQDFNLASPGMAMLELNAYVGDLLSYTIDKKYNELFLDGVQRRSSVYRLAKTFGYKVPGVRPAITLTDISVDVPVNGGEPDINYMPLFRAGTKISGGGQTFETVSDIDFSSDYSEDGQFNRTILPVKNSNQDIIKYTILKREKIVAGTIKITKVEITTDTAKPFFQYILPDTNVLDVVGIIIFPSLGIDTAPTYQDFNDFEKKYWEVEYLPENKIFIDDGTMEGNGLKIGRYIEVQKRFIKEFMSDGRCRITFGGGEANYDAYDDYITSLTSSDVPQITIENTLNNTALGEMVPANSTMFIKYRIGGGVLSNVGSNVLNTISNIDFIINGTNSAINQAVISSARATNPIPALGGLGLPSVDEIKQNVSANFASQQRCVTLEDYISRAYQLPGKFGAPFRIFGLVEDNKVKMYILTRGGDGKLFSVSTNEIKNNLVRYLVPYKMINDFIEINDGKIINLQIEVDLFIDRTYNNSEIKLNAINSIKDFFDIEKWQMNQDIYISQITDILREIPGVLNVVDIRIFNMEGGGYSYTTSPQVNENRVYIPETAGYRTQLSFIDNSLVSFPLSMYEIKFPEKDIAIRVG